MAQLLQIFKGGWEGKHRNKDGSLRDNRLAVNQRPADGHIKAATWEDYIRVNKHRFCDYPQLAVGDVIGIHTTLTFGVIEGLGIAVLTPEEGLKFKLVASDNFDLSGLDFTVYEYDEDKKEFKATTTNVAASALTEIGTKKVWIAGYAKPGAELMRVGNAVQIGLEVVALPQNAGNAGTTWDFDIESRLQMRQSVRPPASLCCC